jgi:hypothetical protein
MMDGCCEEFRLLPGLLMLLDSFLNSSLLVMLDQEDLLLELWEVSVGADTGVWERVLTSMTLDRSLSLAKSSGERDWKAFLGSLLTLKSA